MNTRRSFLKKVGMITLGAVNSAATVPTHSAEITAHKDLNILEEEEEIQ
jgi:hypothetical protein